MGLSFSFMGIILKTISASLHTMHYDYFHVQEQVFRRLHSTHPQCYLSDETNCCRNPEISHDFPSASWRPARSSERTSVRSGHILVIRAIEEVYISPQHDASLA